MNNLKTIIWLLSHEFNYWLRKTILVRSLFFLFVFLNVSSVAQKQNSLWCFGDSAGINFNDTSNIITFATSLDTRGSCVSIADSNGQILFYANTCGIIPGLKTYIWNSSNQLMDEGDAIVGEAWYNELIIIPFPGSNNLYYLFSGGNSSNLGLYYSIIDMNENGGLGKVIQKNILIHTNATWDALAAVKHANGRDWWLISRDYISSLPNGSNTFVKYLITDTGITESVQNIGGFANGKEGTMTFSKTGNKFLCISWAGLIEVLDFDRCTGQFSNEIIVSNNNFSGYKFNFGCAFSPNENLIYISQQDTTSYLFQYDLTAPNIEASQDTISIIQFPHYAGGVLRLAPNDKIYWSCAWTGNGNNFPYNNTNYYTENMNLSVISSPDVLGIGCNFSLYGFSLDGKRTYWGLPNNPDYAMGPLSGSICDSLVNTNSDESKNNFNIYPNPALDKVCVEFINDNIAAYKIYNYLGNFILNGTVLKNNEISIESLSPGIYFLELNFQNKSYKKKIVKLRR